MKKVLLTHTWMTGNLGDVMHTLPIIKHFKDNNCIVHLSGFYPKRNKSWEIVKKSADKFHHEYVFKDSSETRKKLLREYDIIVFVPGPYISGVDNRKKIALSDIEIIDSLESTNVVLAGHSFYNLNSEEFTQLKKADAIVSRDIKSYRYLEENGCHSFLGTDLAFSYLNDLESQKKSKQRWRKSFDRQFNSNHKSLIFLRHDNLDLDSIFEQGFLKIDDINSNGIEVRLQDCSFATSDPLKDDNHLGRKCKEFGLTYFSCKNVMQLKYVIEKSEMIITDRYHPAIIACSIDKPVTLLKSKNDTKMQGLNITLKSKGINNVNALCQEQLDYISKRFIMS